MLGFLVVASIVIGYLMITCFVVAALQEFLKWNEPELEWLYGLIWPLTVVFVTVIGIAFVTWKYALRPTASFFGRPMVMFVTFLTRTHVKLPRMEARK